MCPVTLTGDMKQAFLQIRIREKDRNVLRFHWIGNLQSEDIKIYRFTRGIFDLGESPFLLNGTVKEHVEPSMSKYPELGESIDEINESLYVDEIVTGEVTVEKVKKIKEISEKIFGEACIELHKWHSNAEELEETQEEHLSELSYAKQEFGTRANDCKILGISWDKSKDTIGVDLNIPVKEQSKRGMLKHLASIFDPLGLISPVTLTGEDIYREACDLKLSWNEQLTEPLGQSGSNGVKVYHESLQFLEAYWHLKLKYYPLTYTFLEMQVLKVSQLYCMLLFLKRMEEVKEHQQQRVGCRDEH